MDHPSTQKLAQQVARALDGAPLGFAVVDLSGVCLAANRTLGRWVRPPVASEELRGRSLLEHDGGALAAALEQVQAGERAHVALTDLPLVSERRGNFRVHLAPIRQNGIIVAAGVSFEDQTDHALATEAFRASERRFRRLVESASLGICVHRQGILLYVNPAGIALLGMSSMDEMIGRTLGDFMGPSQRQLEARLCQLRNDARVEPRFAELQRIDGRTLRVELSAVGAPQEDGPVSFMFFREARDVGEARAGGEVLGVELRALLRTMARSFSRAEAAAAATMDGGEAARAALRRAADICERLADGPVDGASKRTDLSATILDAVAMARALDPELEVQCESLEVEGHLDVEPAALRLMLIQFVLTAAEVGSRHATLSVDRATDGDGRAMLRVQLTHDGGGARESAAAAVLERLVAQARGRLFVDGRSTRLELPLAAPAVVDDDVATVLVCDDEARLAMLTAGLLEQHGFEARTVPDVAATRAALEGARADGDLPQVLLLDVNLPGGNAAAVLDALDDLHLDVPVILTSGYAEEDVPEALRKRRLVHAYLAKPYAVERLIDLVQASVSLPRRG